LPTTKKPIEIVDDVNRKMLEKWYRLWKVISCIQRHRWSLWMEGLQFHGYSFNGC